MTRPAAELRDYDTASPRKPLSHAQRRRVAAILRPSGRPTCPHGKLSGIECQGWPCPGYAVLREGMDRVSLQQAGARLHAARSRAMQGRGR